MHASCAPSRPPTQPPHLEALRVRVQALQGRAAHVGEAALHLQAGRGWSRCEPPAALPLLATPELQAGPQPPCKAADASRPAHARWRAWSAPCGQLPAGGGRAGGHAGQPPSPAAGCSGQLQRPVEERRVRLRAAICTCGAGAAAAGRSLPLSRSLQSAPSQPSFPGKPGRGTKPARRGWFRGEALVALAGALAAAAAAPRCRRANCGCRGQQQGRPGEAGGLSL